MVYPYYQPPTMMELGGICAAVAFISFFVFLFVWLIWQASIYDPEKCKDAGRTAYCLGIYHNPYEEGTLPYRDWNEGWHEAQLKNRAAIKAIIGNGKPRRIVYHTRTKITIEEIGDGKL